MNKKLILFAFALSGMTALIYEVVWARPLQLIFGSTIYAVSTILTTFFVGAALGSLVIRNLADRAQNPAVIFAVLQFGIGLYGFILLYVFKVLPGMYLSLTDTPFMQFALLFFVLIIPTTLFGATWPIANKAYAGLDRLGKDSGRLYSFNSFGSFIGSLSAGFLLIPVFGIRTTSLLVATINILIALVVLISLRKEVKNAP